MLVTLLLLLVFALRASVVPMISRVSSTLVVVSTMTIVILVVLHWPSVGRQEGAGVS